MKNWKFLIIILICIIVFLAILFFWTKKISTRKEIALLNKNNEIIAQRQKAEAREKFQRSPEYLVQRQRELGPDWKMVKMTQGKWYGPYKIKGGSGWKIARGEIWVKKGKNSTPYRDRPGVHRYGKGKEVSFSSVTPTAVIFFKY